MEDGVELKAGLKTYITWYNQSRPHSALDDRTPDAVYSGGTMSSCAARQAKAGMSTLFDLSNPFPGPHPRYDYDLSTELSPALYLSSPIGPLHLATTWPWAECRRSQLWSS